jgi:ArsR family transcriptional regulator
MCYYEYRGEMSHSNKAAGYMNLPNFDENTRREQLSQMATSANIAANYLKAIGHGGRLMILCHLTEGEKSVGELEAMLDLPQATVSQQLGRLRMEGIVSPRRQGQTIYYSLSDEKSRKVIGLLYELFCSQGSPK